MSKNWKKSRTIWFNVITTVILMVPIIGTLMKVLDPISAVVIDAVVTCLNGLGNVLIRVWLTEVPISK
jgi:hypothetical protein